MKLLTLNSSKLDKATQFGYLNAALYLSPARLSGWNVCPVSTPGCERGCLNTSGHGGIGLVQAHHNPSGIVYVGTNTVQQARLTRTKMLFEERKAFFDRLLKDMRLLAKQAVRRELKPALRLNGTSDLDWNALGNSSNIDLKRIATLLGITLYEYTKVPNRRTKSPWHHTFSLSEHPDSEKHALKWLQNGHNVAIVFKHTLPSKYSILGKTFDVINGDESDLRFLDPKGVIVGLKAKGWAKKDTTGFVR